jgi:hypothetical protein
MQVALGRNAGRKGWGSSLLTAASCSAAVVLAGRKITEKNKGWCWCDLLLVAGKHCGKLNLIGDFDVEGLQ